MSTRAERLGRRLLLVGGALAVIAAGLGIWSATRGDDGPSGPISRARVAQGGGLGQFSQVNELNGTLAIDRAPDGTRAIHARYGGGGANGYQRAIFNIDWKAGTTVAYSARFYLPSSLFDSLQGQVALMRWDDFPDHPEDQAHGGIVVFGRDKLARLVREQLDTSGSTTEDEQLGAPFQLPRDRWFLLQVVQHLGGDDARSEAFLDGKRIAESDDPNLTEGRVARRVRYGVTAIASGAQKRPLELWFDDAQAQPGAVAGG